MNVLLMGMKHCGKSTVGRGLAGRMGCEFRDLDTMIEQAWQAGGGSGTVREIFAARGADGFEQLEAQAMYELAGLMARPGRCVVAALGGRTPMNPRFDVVADAALKVYMHLPADEAYARVERTGTPAFLAGSADPRADFHALYLQREPLYRRWADVVVDVGGLDAPQALQRVLEAIRERDDGRQQLR